MIVFETIQKLIRVQGYASISLIASCSGLPRAKVLDVLDRNAGLLRRKGTKIVAVVESDVSEAISRARASGKVFWQDTINYGAATALEWLNNPEADKLRRGYACGGLGDSYSVQVVLDTPENREKLVSLGMTDKINPKDWPGFLEWKEDGTQA